jgi:hypothetical protein
LFVPTARSVSLPFLSILAKNLNLLSFKYNYLLKAYILQLEISNRPPFFQKSSF